MIFRVGFLESVAELPRELADVLHARFNSLDGLPKQGENIFILLGKIYFFKDMGKQIFKFIFFNMYSYYINLFRWPITQVCFT